MSAAPTVKKLDNEVKKNGFTYRLVKRNDERCIYSQHNAAAKVVGYEMFKIRLGDQRKVKERWAKLQHKAFNPEDYEELFELFPSNEEFGKRAWSYKTLEEAELAFNSK